jgi:hypothetical protein
VFLSCCGIALTLECVELAIVVTRDNATRLLTTMLQLLQSHRNDTGDRKGTRLAFRETSAEDGSL